MVAILVCDSHRQAGSSTSMSKRVYFPFKEQLQNIPGSLQGGQRLITRSTLLEGDFIINEIQFWYQLPRSKKNCKTHIQRFQVKLEQDRSPRYPLLASRLGGLDSNCRWHLVLTLHTTISETTIQIFAKSYSYIFVRNGLTQVSWCLDEEGTQWQRFLSTLQNSTAVQKLKYCKTALWYEKFKYCKTALRYI